MILRCGKCDAYLGESTVELVYVDHVDHSRETKVEPPRDLRACKCGAVNVYIPRADLDGTRVYVVR